MACSPLLDGISDPLEVLKVVAAHHILRYSEPPDTFYPLKEKGWVEYAGGHWRITDAGKEVLPETSPDEQPSKTSLSDFFGLGDPP